MNWIKKNKIIVGVIGFILLISLIGSTGNNSKTTSPTDNNQTNKSVTESQKPSDTPKPSESENLTADIKKAYDVPGIEVTNKDKTKWENCKLKLNDDYIRLIRNPIEPNDPLNNPYALFTKNDGTKFNYLTTAPKGIYITCDVNGTSKWGYWTFSN